MLLRRLPRSFYICLAAVAIVIMCSQIYLGRSGSVVKTAIKNSISNKTGEQRPQIPDTIVKDEKSKTITKEETPASPIEDRTPKETTLKSERTNLKKTDNQGSTTGGKERADKVTMNTSDTNKNNSKEKEENLTEPKAEEKAEPKEEKKEETKEQTSKPKEEKTIEEKIVEENKEQPKEEKKDDTTEEKKEQVEVEKKEEPKKEQKEEKNEQPKIEPKEDKKKEPNTEKKEESKGEDEKAILKTEVRLTTSRPVVVSTKPPPPKAPVTIERVIPDKAPRYDNVVIPKIVHVTWFYPEKKCDLHFYDLICLLSVHKFIKPDKLFVWYTSKPCGKWWQEAKEKIPYIELKYMEAPTSIYGHEINVPEHKSDVARMKIMEEYGGIYMDLDIIVLKPWEPLLHYNFTLAAESTQNFGNGVILSTPNNTFLRMWREGYHDFNDKAWAKHSLFLPFTLARNNPELVHVEWDSILRPTWKELHWIYKDGKLWDWSTSYAMHLYYRFHGIKHNPEDIKTMNNTLGQIFRHVYYGTAKLMN